MRVLRQRAAVDLDRLGEIERDPVAMRPERAVGEAERGLVLNEGCRMRRADQQAAEPLGSATVEVAITERRRGEPVVEVRVERLRERGGHGVSHDGVANRAELRAVVSEGGGHDADPHAAIAAETATGA